METLSPHGLATRFMAPGFLVNFQEKMMPSYSIEKRPHIWGLAKNLFLLKLLIDDCSLIFKFNPGSHFNSLRCPSTFGILFYGFSMTFFHSCASISADFVSASIEVLFGWHQMRLRHLSCMYIRRSWTSNGTTGIEIAGLFQF